MINLAISSGQIRTVYGGSSAEELPVKLDADVAYQNAQVNSDKQNARIEHDKALARVITAFLKDDTELFKQFC